MNSDAEHGVHRTLVGTPYLKQPFARIISRPMFEREAVQDFLDGFAPDLGFAAYTDDPTDLPFGTELVKFAGQICYLSLGERRTWNAQAGKYIDHILESGHGSVLEHANYSLLLWGISRSITHELVRHRAGFAYSQVSQRYVGADLVRFVERPEWQADEILHGRFEARIDVLRAEYEALAELLESKRDEPEFRSLPKTERRKAVQQAARACLPNETEAPIVVTGNARAWRHFIEMRGSRQAEVEIRRLALKVYGLLHDEEPLLFAGYEPVSLPDGTDGLASRWTKV